MTTEIKITSCEDISVMNDVMNFDQTKLSKDHILAATSWLTITSSAHASLHFVSQFVCDMVSLKLPEYKLWFLIGSPTWQEDTRIVRYKRLLGSLKAQGIEISPSSDSQEMMIDSHGKLKFFCAIPLPELSMESIVNFLMDEQCVYLIAIPDDIHIWEILTIGWSGYLDDDFNLINHLVKIDGLIFKKVGDFDDPERGIVTIGQRELVKVLMS